MAHMVKLRASLKGLANGTALLLRRNMGATSVLSQVEDPIQKLFLSKLDEYKEKAADLGDGKLVDSNAEVEANVAAEIENLQRRYGGGDLEAFPKFSFEE